MGDSVAARAGRCKPESCEFGARETVILSRQPAKPEGEAIDSISILGSGWLGLPLAAHFAALGYRVRTSTRSAGRLPVLAAVPSEPHLVDLGQPADSIDAFLQSRVLIVNIPSKDIDGFRWLAGKVEAAGVEAVLFVSSTSVYPPDSGVVSESSGVEIPDHPLVVIENLFREGRGFRTTIVRFGGLVGPGRHPGRFFRGGKTLREPNAPVNLVHLDDCIGIIERIVAGEAWGETFNACADTHPRKLEFYTHAAKLAGAPAPLFEADGGQTTKSVDSGKLKRVLGYRFRHPDPMAIRFDTDTCN